LNCTETNTGIRINVPELYIWNVIKIEFEDTASERHASRDSADRSGAVALPSVMSEDTSTEP
jgi:hypothetical protein